MTLILLQLIIMLIIIFISAALFTNALEYFGQNMGISEGAIGSIFAAVVTALPETTIPILAIVVGTSNRSINEEISVGAILGAPLMLSTLSIALMAMSVINLRGMRGRLNPEITGLKRDLNYFLLAFLLAAFAMYVPLEKIYFRLCISLLLIFIYLIYFYHTLKASKNLVKQGHHVKTNEPLFLTKIGCQHNSHTIWIQMILGLILLLFGAKGFIDGMETISKTLHISALVISLLIIPFATELPEKVNSILWVRKNKDTMGFGNITGAMVFQGTLLPALGILLTPWQPSKEVLTAVTITLIATIWLRLNTAANGLKITALFLNGCFYFCYLYLIFR